MIFTNKWARRYISRRWGPGILTKVDQNVSEIHGEQSESKEMDYVLFEDIDTEYKTEFEKWMTDNNINIRQIKKYTKKLNEVIVEQSEENAVSLEDWKNWLRWKLGLTKTKQKPTGIPSEI